MGVFLLHLTLNKQTTTKDKHDTLTFTIFLFFMNGYGCGYESQTFHGRQNCVCGRLHWQIYVCGRLHCQIYVYDHVTWIWKWSEMGSDDGYGRQSVSETYRIHHD